MQFNSIQRRVVVRHPLLWVFLLLLLSRDKISDVDIHHLYTQICGKDIIIKKTTFEGLKWYFTQKSLNLCFNFILKQNHQIYKYTFIWRNNSFEKMPMIWMKCLMTPIIQNECFRCRSFCIEKVPASQD